jgi:O-acetylserine/cysteine efflux transporter
MQSRRSIITANALFHFLAEYRCSPAPEPFYNACMTRYHIPGRDLALIVLVCVAWAGNFIAGSRGMEHFSPFVFMTFRFVILLLLLAPFLRKPPPGQWTRLIGVCLSIGALHFTALFIALGRSEDVSSIALVQQIYIPMAVIMALLLLGERTGWRTMLATAVAFIGVFIIGYDPMVLGQLDVLFITLISALFQALGSIYQRGIRGVGVLNFQAWTAVIALPVMLAASLLTESNQWETISTATWQDWAPVFYSALVASIVGHGLFFWLVQRHPVSEVMPYLQMTPVFAVIFGILIWGDQPGWRLYLGGMVVIMGILIITLRARRKSLSSEVVQKSG